jgi:(S)-2-hydroxyglutarate dehydrogenase
MVTCDFLVVGAGVVGVNVARALKAHFADSKVILIEKESACGLHASTRNSGVLHAGFYYSSDSLKAKFTKVGNQLLTQYCEDNKLPINRCGKLVVAKNHHELIYLDELLKRGKKNGIELQEISADDALRIEPRVKTTERALFSPTTSSVDPRKVLQCMVRDARSAGVEIHNDVAFLKKTRTGILTSKGAYDAGYLVNAAGLYADKVASEYGFSQHYKILPFKGLYLYSNEPQNSVRTNIYPVPDLRNPFLGVHFTITVDGIAKIGPTAIPAFWRENYDGWEGFNFGELADIFSRQASLFISANFDFKKLAIEEIRKYSRKKMVFLAKAMIKDTTIDHYTKWGTPGIRAQLVNIKTKKLEMDFVIEGDDKSTHILNAVSPGFTCSIPFSRHVVDTINASIK